MKTDEIGEKKNNNNKKTLMKAQSRKQEIILGQQMWLED
jgi:hypothetical protein